MLLCPVGSYDVDMSLAICRQYEITMAVAFLLERSGDYSSSLEQLLEQLNDRIGTLQKVFLNSGSKKTAAVELADAEAMRNVDDALNQVRRWLQSPAAARAWHDGWIAVAPPHEAAVATPVPSAGDPAVPPIQVDRGSELSRVGQPLVPDRFPHLLRRPASGSRASALYGFALLLACCMLPCADERGRSAPQASALSARVACGGRGCLQSLRCGACGP